jgi:aminopeptidase S
MPKVIQVIHSARDTAAELDSGRVNDALRVVEHGLRAWDAAPAH